jgi:predicted nucleic acid-binding Zn finger protein
MEAKVKSFTNGSWYKIVVHGEKLTGKATCSCPAWIYKKERKDCKHIKAARKGFEGFPQNSVQVITN